MKNNIAPHGKRGILCDMDGSMSTNAIIVI
jgi:hypothetical protein